MNNNITDKGISELLNSDKIQWNLSPASLIEKTIQLKQGKLSDSGALMVDTGEFTGRSPKDKFTVKDNITKDTVWWGDINFPVETNHFDALCDKMLIYANNKELYIHDAYVCADPDYRLNVRVITETPWANLFAANLFIRPTKEELNSYIPEWHILCLPGFRSKGKEDGTRQHNFTMLNFSRKMILIGGSGYTGEIKKSVFTLLNYLLPIKGVLSMHCSANIGKDGDTAIFFGLSGTGKTTLSADPSRRLIGDDEHGWSDNTVFNFEGGCYAKAVNLSKEKEPQIYNAIRFGALLENVRCRNDDDRCVDYDNISVTENTRAAYPIHFINNAIEPSIGKPPHTIFFLTCDAFGVLPPISLLTIEQAMYHFISGYTAKVAGTEVGVTEPQLTFSACFGKAFLPLHPIQYATLLGKKLKGKKVKVWLVNTGWTGGAFGTGTRMKLPFTRAMITAALNNELEKQNFELMPVFNLRFPTACPGVPDEILNPRNTWKDKDAYDAKANELAHAFIKNFKQFSDQEDKDILMAAPKPAHTHKEIRISN